MEPTIELVECSAGVAEARCGVLEVQENRAAPNGRTIELKILVAPATSRSPKRDPVFLLAGGPGQGAAELGPMILHKFDALRRERDMVFVDVRGTGGSGPLACDFEDHEDLEQLLGATFDIDELDACLEGYRDSHGAELDLRQYTSAAMVEDLDEVRAALGYEQVNLLAISYGTVVAQQWMRRHPEHVRSAVLDGVVPIDVRPGMVQMPANSERALKRVLADCREHQACAAAFPGLERKLAQVLTELETNRKLEEFEHPRTGERVRVELTREGFVQVLGGTLYSGGLTALLPLLIERAHAGDYAPIAAMALRLGKFSKTVSMGLYLSVACAEELGRLDETIRREAVAGLEVFSDHMLAQLEQACARWPHAEVPAEFHEPIRSEVPTLLLSGTYDPVTPPAFAERLAAQLADARHLVVDAVNHGVWNQGCAPKLIAGFFVDADPSAVDGACLDALRRPGVFVSPNGPWPPPEPEPQQPSAGDEQPSTTNELAQGLAQGELSQREH